MHNIDTCQLDGGKFGEREQPERREKDKETDLFFEAAGSAGVNNKSVPFLVVPFLEFASRRQSPVSPVSSADSDFAKVKAPRMSPAR